MKTIKIGLNTLDLSFRHMKSIGIFNVVIGLGRKVADQAGAELTVECGGDFKVELIRSEHLY